MPNFSAMGVEPRQAAQYSHLVGRLMMYSKMAVEGLTVEQLCDTHGGLANSIGFDVWHVVRTTDNIVQFVFEREQPIWLSGGFHERWGLPKVDQGTGMNADDAYGLRFPAPEEFKQYIRAVEESVVPRIAAMSDEYLATAQFIRPWGELPRMEAIGHGLIGHGNGHLGRACLARSLYGLPGLPF